MKRLASLPLFVTAMLMLLALAFLSVVLPDRNFSNMENRPLVSLEQPSTNNILSGRWMQQAEDYAADQFPFRDFFVQLNLAKEQALLQTEHAEIVIGNNGRLFYRADRMPTNTAYAANIQAIGKLAKASNLPVSLVVIPQSTQLYQAQLPAFYPLEDMGYHTLETLARDQGLTFVPSLQALKNAAQTWNTHYRTDHHLTWHGARAVAEAVLANWQLPLVPPDSIVSIADFLGSYYTRAPLPFLQPETMTYGQYDNLTVYLDEVAKSGLTDPDLMKNNNKYAALLFNNPGYLRIQNSQQKEGALLVIRDSNANVLLPAIAQHFRRVEVLDLRFFSGNLMAFVQQKEVQQILCLFGADVFATDRNLALQMAGI